MTRFSAPSRQPPADDAPAAGGPAAGRHISRRRVIRRPAAVAALVIGLVLAGTAGTGLAVESQTGHRPAAPAPRLSFAPLPRGKQAAVPSAVAAPVARPVSLDIPAIDVSTRIIHLGLTKSGALQVPTSIHVAGWYTGSPRPGAPGGAVIAGHIDSYTGPGVFYDLDKLRPGQRVFVRRADHTLAVFRVTMVRSYLKSKFPTNAVYGPTPDSELRLITCGGTFDSTTGHYRSNTIVYASLVH
jgi:sortase (surface protein transpeptidase)